VLQRRPDFKGRGTTIVATSPTLRVWMSALTTPEPVLTQKRRQDERANALLS